ncbi:hypothetical protein BRAS3809_360005 [Bradyrhizobium sp. STM 3809]|nr:hypothetical protein BRAS3809_360005 [Bradyrhizobium sp. STM 3809]
MEAGMSSNSTAIAKASLALTATLAISALPDNLTLKSAPDGNALSRIEAIRAALTDGGHSVLLRQGLDGDYVVTQFAQNFSNSFQKARCSASNTC